MTPDQMRKKKKSESEKRRRAQKKAERLRLEAAAAAAAGVPLPSDQSSAAASLAARPPSKKHKRSHSVPLVPPPQPSASSGIFPVGRYPAVFRGTHPLLKRAGFEIKGDRVFHTLGELHNWLRESPLASRYLTKILQFSTLFAEPGNSEQKLKAAFAEDRYLVNHAVFVLQRLFITAPDASAGAASVDESFGATADFLFDGGPAAPTIPVVDVPLIHTDLSRKMLWFCIKQGIETLPKVKPYPYGAILHAFDNMKPHFQNREGFETAAKIHYKENVDSVEKCLLIYAACFAAIFIGQ